MQKARLVKANEQAPAPTATPRPQPAPSGQMRRAVTEWVSERAASQRNARQSFAALFAER